MRSFVIILFLSILTFCGALHLQSRSHSPLHTHAIRQVSKPKTCPTTGRSAPAKKVGCTWNVPGVGRFTQHRVLDFTKLKTRPEFLWPSNYGMTINTGAFKGAQQFYSRNNVALKDGSLNLKVPSKHTKSRIESAQIETTEHDIKYASVRTVAKISGVPGVCHGFFMYASATQETDIEILTTNGRSIHYTNQNTAGSWMSGEKTISHDGCLPANAATTFHEYRLDWTPGRTAFYLNGKLQAETRTSIPSKPGPWMWNNWSNGDKFWTQGPPKSDSILKIQKIDMYYNRTSTRGTC